MQDGWTYDAFVPLVPLLQVEAQRDDHRDGFGEGEPPSLGATRLQESAQGRGRAHRGLRSTTYGC